MKITEIRFGMLRVPLKTPFKTALRTVDTIEDIIVCVHTDTGHIGYGENPDTLETVFFGTNTRTIESLSFVAPMAYTLELLMMWTDTTRVLTFGIAASLGMIAGSAAYALVSKSFRWESFASAEDVGNHLVGATMMGFGGVTALGCTIGQGITGVSTLAVGSLITLLAIVAGSWATMKYQYWRLMREA